MARLNQTTDVYQPSSDTRQNKGEDRASSPLISDLLTLTYFARYSEV